MDHEDKVATKTKPLDLRIPGGAGVTLQVGTLGVLLILGKDVMNGLVDVAVTNERLTSAVTRLQEDMARIASRVEANERATRRLSEIEAQLLEIERRYAVLAACVRDPGGCSL